MIRQLRQCSFKLNNIRKCTIYQKQFYLNLFDGAAMRCTIYEGVRFIRCKISQVFTVCIVILTVHILYSYTVFSIVILYNVCYVCYTST